MSISIAHINNAVSEVVPDRAALVFRDLTLTFAEVAERTNRLANVLLKHGVTISRERDTLENWQCGQSTVALYLYNGNEYLEGMLGAFKARAVPFNINYRYVAEEVRYVLLDAGTEAVVYHKRFAPVVREAIDNLTTLKCLIEVDDDSDVASIPGALNYETVLSQASPACPELSWSVDDIYMLYTGGTTGMPKGVLWRQGDSVVAQLAGRDNAGNLLSTLDAFRERALNQGGHRILPTSPFMHGAGSFSSFAAWHAGNTVVIQSDVARLNPADVLATAERHRTNMVLLIGDAFGRPLATEAASGQYNLDAVKVLFNTGALLSEEVKHQLLLHFPRARIVDGLGSSETGPQAVSISNSSDSAISGAFVPNNETFVIADDRKTRLSPGDDSVGWLTRSGCCPLGYLNDKDKTQRTFPVIDGVRHVISGDRVRWRADGVIEYQGRESFTINSGGEKIFAEEVEHALALHPDVEDVLVSSRSSRRWGQEVVAVVQMKAGKQGNEASLNATASKVIARYKLPKHFVFVERIKRGANGKADYRWAKALAESES